MRRTKPSVTVIMALLAMALLMTVAGCAGGFGYVDEGPEWDGGVIVGGGYGRDHHDNAFRQGDGRRSASAGSDRGRTSMGSPAGGGGHGSSGGGGHASGGGGGHR